MSQEIIQTQMPILPRRDGEMADEDVAIWTRIFELYHPVMVAFATRVGVRENAEVVAISVRVKLLDALKQGRDERRPGSSFRRRIKTMICNAMNDLCRREKARGEGRDIEPNEAAVGSQTSLERNVDEFLNELWVKSCQEAAVKCVLGNSAISQQTKDIYRSYVLDGRPIDEVAMTFGVSVKLVSQVKTRVDRMISAMMAEYGE